MNNFLTHKESQKLYNKILTKAIDNMTANVHAGELVRVSFEGGEIHRTIIPLTEIYKVD